MRGFVSKVRSHHEQQQQNSNKGRNDLISRLTLMALCMRFWAESWSQRQQQQHHQQQRIEWFTLPRLTLKAPCARFCVESWSLQQQQHEHQQQQRIEWFTLLRLTLRVPCARFCVESWVWSWVWSRPGETSHLHCSAVAATPPAASDCNHIGDRPTEIRWCGSKICNCIHKIMQK